jgi:hypothetical protein
MAQRSSFAEMKAEQARTTQSWKAEGRVRGVGGCRPEICRNFFRWSLLRMEMGRRGNAAYSQGESRRALRQAWNEQPR